MLHGSRARPRASGRSPGALFLHGRHHDGEGAKGQQRSVEFAHVMGLSICHFSRFVIYPALNVPRAEWHHKFAI